MKDKYLKCSCGCVDILTPVTEKKPKKGVCAQCKKDVDLRGVRLILV